MSADVRRLVSLAWGERRSRLFWIVFMLCAILPLSKVAETLILRHDDENFPEVINRRCADYLTTAANEFGTMQRVARRTATEVAQLPPVLDYLARRDTSRADLFDAIIRLARE